MKSIYYFSLLWRHNGHDGVSNHQPHECLLNRSFMRRSKETSKLRVTGLCAGNSLQTGEFPAQMASNAENVSIWWRHRVFHGGIASATDDLVWVQPITYHTMGSAFIISTSIHKKPVTSYQLFYKNEP